MSEIALKSIPTQIKTAPLQAPESYNLSQVLEMVKKANANHPSD
jgi:hypothetical protein